MHKNGDKSDATSDQEQKTHVNEKLLVQLEGMPLKIVTVFFRELSKAGVASR